jgi:predicted ATPase
VELLKEDPELLKRVNAWLKHFDIEINVVQFKELIHRLTVKQRGLDLDLDITDVGFGVSQVLPVIVQVFLAPTDSVTLVEQPEIHLHPKMQADLADLFIEMVRPRGRRAPGRRGLLVETHSEYLLKRLRRRLAEKAVTPDDVAIYFVFHDAEKGAAGLEEIDIPASGDFEWPKEFYASDLADTMAFGCDNEVVGTAAKAVALVTRGLAK